MTINFAKGAWTADAVAYAYSRRFPDTPVFRQEEDCVVNQRNPDTEQGYDFITLLTHETYTAGCRITARCAFEGDAAPLIVLAKDMEPDEGGDLRYADYFEVVLWKNGVNVWHLWPDANGRITWQLRMGVEFPVSAEEIHTLTVETAADRLTITADGRVMKLCVPDLFGTYHVGINACEGICRFYEMTAEQN